MAKRSILIVGGGTAGWLTAAYLARFFDLPRNPRLSITLLASDEIGSIGVGEGAFPTIRDTLRFIGIDESAFVRATSATRSEEHTSELQSLMRISYAVFCLKKKK